MPFYPDKPIRAWEAQIFKWVAYPLAAILFIAWLAWSYQVRTERSECEERCAADGAPGFIYVPADGRVGRPSECICK